MTPERAAALVARWVRLYTRGLPADRAERRVGEIQADLHDHLRHERAHGTSEARIARSLLARMLRGLPADAAWRHASLRSSTREHPMTTSPLRRSAIRVALITATILLIPLIANVTQDGPGWSVPDFVMGAVLLFGTGMLLELVGRNPRSVPVRAAIVVIGLAAIVLGEMDDAPGLMLFGGLAILGTLALSARTLQRSR